MSTPLPLPPGYRALAALDRSAHRNLGIDEAQRGPFAAGLHGIHVLALEFIQAARHYPVVFARDPASGQFVSMAVTGLTDGRNLFVDAAGRWDPAAYVPAYVRRWPLFPAHLADAAAGAPDTLILVDPTALTPDATPPLFDAAGQPGPEWTRLEALVRDSEGARRQTEALIAALVEHDLLVPFEAHAFARDGQDLHLRGMFRVEEERLQDLDGKALKRLMRQGLLARIYAHLMSLDNFKFLLDRAVARAASA
jgi:hypothetical protein